MGPFRAVGTAQWQSLCSALVPSAAPNISEKIMPLDEIWRLECCKVCGRWEYLTEPWQAWGSRFGGKSVPFSVSYSQLFVFNLFFIWRWAHFIAQAALELLILPSWSPQVSSWHQLGLVCS